MPQQQLQTAQLHPLTAAEIPTVIDIGRSIWLEHYVPLIGEAQVNYMTSQRFTTEYLSRYLPENATGDDGQPVRWLDLLRLEGETVGYCSHSLGPNPTELKLEQLYLLPGLHGRGLGGLMMRHIEQHARSLGRTTLWLTVNKHNAGSIAVYNRSGYTIREEAVFDIGNGYVMDDYVMEKKLV